MTAIHVYDGADSAAPVVRKIHPSDIVGALREGFDDFRAMPSHLAFLGVLYPLAGVGLTYAATRADLLQLVFPLASGFALIGPVVATFLYEMSRRRERGLDTDWSHAFDVLRSPSLPAIGALSLGLVAVFALWVAVAEALYQILFGDARIVSLGALLGEVVGTGRGQALFLVGGAVGFAFAAAVFAVSVISFPLLLDRDVGLVAAVRTSVAAVRASPLTFALWAFTIAAALVLGSLPLLIGLALVMPLLGHASWRLYRRAVARDPEHELPAEPAPWRPGPSPRFVSQPHSVLFPIGPGGRRDGGAK